MSLILAVTMAACGGGSGPASDADKSGAGTAGYHVAVIPKGTTHEFWNSIHAGAVKAQRELASRGVAVRLTWKGPIREDDREQQIQVVEGFLSQGVSGVVLAPLDASARRRSRKSCPYGFTSCTMPIRVSVRSRARYGNITAASPSKRGNDVKRYRWPSDEMSAVCGNRYGTRCSRA